MCWVFRSFNHKVHTIRSNKIALTAYYDKMQMVDSYTCVPFGYVENKLWYHIMSNAIISTVYVEPSGYGSIKSTFKDAKEKDKQLN